jgi:hypothetical protein
LWIHEKNVAPSANSAKAKHAEIAISTALQAAEEEVVVIQFIDCTIKR